MKWFEECQESDFVKWYNKKDEGLSDDGKKVRYWKNLCLQTNTEKLCLKIRLPIKAWKKCFKTMP